MSNLLGKVVTIATIPFPLTVVNVSKNNLAIFGLVDTDESETLTLIGVNDKGAIVSIKDVSPGAVTVNTNA